ncbi:hypothetical protein [Desertibaculum subflavum]|uniref:hypothetical protein n=1 Tax=Desertibaculum subflavum TaxID=2268458 RepID=UPI000E66530D
MSRETPYQPYLSEHSFRIRRRHVLRAIRDRDLTPSAKQVLVALSLAADDPFVLPDPPPVAALAAKLGLAERTVRQAIADLVTAGHLTFRRTGEPFRLNQPPPTDPAARPDLARERAFLDAARAPLTFEEHVEMLGRLRDRAVAAGRIATAVRAERAIGRAYGLARPPSPPRPPKTDYDEWPAEEKKRRYLEAARDALLRSYAADPHYAPIINAFCDKSETLIRENRAAEAAAKRLQ